MKHLVRAGVLLIIILLAAFGLPRILHSSNVKDLAAYGFYNGTDNSQQWKQVTAQYADPNDCGKCHQDNHSLWSNSVHKTVSCENCHGPGQQHIDKGTPLTINTSKELCENCHASVPGRPSSFPQIDPAQHHPQLDCITCHNPHDPPIPVMPHVEVYWQWSNCVLCHKTGGLVPYPANHEGLDSSACLTCHAR